jgi:RNA polymerase sigma-70 factor (ECF subfamily)
VIEDFAKRSDGELLWAAKADPRAFSEFYRRHAVAVERWLRSQTPDLATAADLTAETFAQALTSLNRFRGTNDDQAIAWLFAIARNQVRRFYRQGRVELEACRRLGVQLDHDEDELVSLEARLDALAETARLSEAVEALPDVQRQSLRLRVLDELGYDRVADLTGTSKQNARARVSRALRTLSFRFQGDDR